MVGLAQDRRCAVKIYPGMPAAEKKRGAEGEFLAKDLSIWRQPPGPEADAGSGSRIQVYVRPHTHSYPSTMDLLHHEGIRYTMHTEPSGQKLRVFVLCTHQEPGEMLFPRIGSRFDIRDEFATPTSAYAAALSVARRLVAGEISASSPEVKKKVGQYQLIASAAFQIDGRRWEPILKIKSKRPENKGAVQDLLDDQTSLQRNPCPTAARATEYAIEYGEKLVLKIVPGLKI